MPLLMPLVVFRDRTKQDEAGVQDALTSVNRTSAEDIGSRRTYVTGLLIRRLRVRVSPPEPLTGAIPLAPGPGPMFSGSDARSPRSTPFETGPFARGSSASSAAPRSV